MKNPLAPSSSYHRVISKVIGRKISYLDISEEAREGMKEMGMNDWLIDVIMDGFNYIISGKYGSQTTNVIEKVTGRKQLKIIRLIMLRFDMISLTKLWPGSNSSAIQTIAQ